VPMGPQFRKPLLPGVLVRKLQIDVFDARFGEAIFFGIRRKQLQRLHPGLPCALPIARLAGELGVLHQRVKLLLLGERHSRSNRSPRRMEKPGIKLDWKLLFREYDVALIGKRKLFAIRYRKSTLFGAATRDSGHFLPSFAKVSFSKRSRSPRSGTKRWTRSSCHLRARPSGSKQVTSGPCALPPKSYSCSPTTLPSLRS
jgi:hypothetical protein